MPRTPDSFEARILTFFQTGDLGAAKLLLGLVTAAVRNRQAGVRWPPARSAAKDVATTPGTPPAGPAMRSRRARTADTASAAPSSPPAAAPTDEPATQDVASLIGQ